MPSERIIRSELGNGEPLWFIEVDAAAAGRLRLFLVVDCSDSFWPELAPALERLLLPLLDKLVSNDRVEVWLLGESRAAYSASVSLGGVGRSLYAGVRGALKPTQAGTWFDPTLRTIFASRRQRGETPILVLITDGEVFDAGCALGQPFERSLVLGPGRSRVELERLVPGASVQDVERPSFDAALLRPSVQCSLELDWSGRLA